MLKHLLSSLLCSTLVTILSAPTAAAQSGSTLTAVRANGHVRCGVDGNIRGFSYKTAEGVWAGLEVDVCRAVAAATLGDASKVVYQPVEPTNALQALTSGSVDLLVAHIGRSSGLHARHDIRFTPTIYHDGVQIRVLKDLGVGSARELNGATVCLRDGTPHEATLRAWAQVNRMQVRPSSYATMADVVKTFRSRRCDVWMDHTATLLGAMSRAERVRSEILPENIGHAPIAPLVRQGDEQWFKIVELSTYAMIGAELMEVDANSLAADGGQDSQVRRFLAAAASAATGLGIDEAWAVRIIQQVGTYGESYQR
ncbi:MAG: transporter substrate-binding domain-containing protein, partial [Myxococcota bacterium]